MYEKGEKDSYLNIYGWDLTEQPDLSASASIDAGDTVEQTLTYSTSMSEFSSGEIPGAANEISSFSRDISGTNLDDAWSIDWERCYYSEEGKFLCSITRQVPAS